MTLQRTQLLRDHGHVVPASNWGKVKTVTQVVAVTLYLYPGIPAVARQIALGIAVIATVVSGLEYFLRVRGLRAALPSPSATKD